MFCSLVRVATLAILVQPYNNNNNNKNSNNRSYSYIYVHTQIRTHVCSETYWGVITQLPVCLSAPFAAYFNWTRGRYTVVIFWEIYIFSLLHVHLHQYIRILASTSAYHIRISTITMRRIAMASIIARSAHCGLTNIFHWLCKASVVVVLPQCVAHTHTQTHPIRDALYVWWVCESFMAVLGMKPS